MGLVAPSSKLLQDDFLLGVVAELVGAEKVAVVEGCEVVDVDLPGLEGRGEGTTTPQAGKKRLLSILSLTSDRPDRPSERRAVGCLDESKSYLILEVLLGNLHRVVLNAVATPLVRRLLGHQLFEDKEQQLVVVPAEGQISSKGLPIQKKEKKWS